MSTLAHDLKRVCSFVSWPEGLKAAAVLQPPNYEYKTGRPGEIRGLAESLGVCGCS